MNFYPYDNKQIKFNHTDEIKSDYLEAIGLLVGHSKLNPEDIRYYDISFFSGGTGINDWHAITLNSNSYIWNKVKKYLKVKTPDDLASDNEWGEFFLWLIDNESHEVSNEIASTLFINENKNDFQLKVNSGDNIYFSQNSDVNSYDIIWGNESTLNYISFCQG